MISKFDKYCTFIFNCTDTSDMALARIRRNHILQPAESYTSKVNVMIPRQIFGVFYIAVKTDINNEVFEYASEDNNIAVSVSW